MKRIILITLIFVVTFILIVCLILNKKQSTKSLSIYIIDGNNYHLLEARSPIEWTKGLMYYKNKNELSGADGMIFIFPEKEKKSFWNKNTYLDLDLYWMDGDKVVGKSYLPSVLKSKKIVVVNSGKKVDRVVELIN